MTLTVTEKQNTLALHKDLISRELYDMIVETASFDMGAYRDDLTRTQDLSLRWGWCKVGNHSFRPNGHSDRERLVRTGVCADCEFWLDLWRMRDEPETIRTAQKHYRYGQHCTAELDASKSLEQIAKDWHAKTRKSGLGCGGALVIVRFNDGRVVITNDLWGQGDLPDDYAALLPNDAVLEWV